MGTSLEALLFFLGGGICMTIFLVHLFQIKHAFFRGGEGAPEGTGNLWDMFFFFLLLPDSRIPARRKMRKSRKIAQRGRMGVGGGGGGN